MEVFDQHEYQGICEICGWSGVFKREHRAIRETYACGSCKANLRYRVLAEAILECFGEQKVATLKALATYPAFSDLTIFEPGPPGPFRTHLSKIHGYRASVQSDATSVKSAAEAISKNMLATIALSDASVDLVITSDIFEHIRKPREAFREIHRILRPGGYHIFTIPTAYPLPPTTVKRVNVEAAEDVPILEPVFHGDGKGGKSIVYNDFGRDLLDELSAIGLITSIHLHATKEKLVRTASAFVSMKVDNWLLSKS